MNEDLNIGDIVRVVPPDLIQEFSEGTYPFSSTTEDGDNEHYYICDSTLQSASEGGPFVITEKAIRVGYCEYCIEPVDGNDRELDHLVFHQNMLEHGYKRSEYDMVAEPTLEDFICSFKTEVQ